MAAVKDKDSPGFTRRFMQHLMGRAEKLQAQGGIPKVPQEAPEPEGKLTPEQEARVQAVFAAISGGKESFSREELTVVNGGQDEIFTTNDLWKKLHAEADEDGDDRVQLHEFLAFHAALKAAKGSALCDFFLEHLERGIEALPECPLHRYL